MIYRAWSLALTPPDQMAGDAPPTPKTVAFGFVAAADAFGFIAWLW